MTNENGYWKDENGNRWNENDYSEERAEYLSSEMKSCSKCVDCEDCKDCYDCFDCASCARCNSCDGCIDCNDCSECVNCGSASFEEGIDNTGNDPFNYKK